MNFCKYLSYSTKWSIIILFTCMELNSCQVKDKGWIKDRQISNWVCPKLANRISRSRSVTECGTQCMQEECVSFIYAADNNTCYLMKSAITSTTECNTRNGAKYYATITNEISCLPDDRTYRISRLRNGELLSYRVGVSFFNVHDAREECKSTGGDLIKLSTIPKLEFIQELLRKCHGFSNVYFFVDGSDKRTPDSLTVEDWRWSDGEPIPINSTFWTPGHPNDPIHENCLIITNTQWLFDDHFCGAHLPFICEKQLR